MTVPNVLATRYASVELAAIWSPEHKIVLERQLWIAVLRAQTRPRHRRAGRRGRGLRGRRRSRREGGRPGLDRRARASDAPRRQGADRGVQRLAGSRAHPQGHDLPRPDRERRAAPGPAVPGAAPGPGGRRAGPARAAGRRARATVMAGRSHNVAAQATTLGKRFATRRRGAAGRGRTGRGAARPLPAARDQGPDGHRAGHARPARRRRDPAWWSSSRGWRSTSASSGC